MAPVYARDLFHQGYARTRKGSCFVLMPFANQFDEVYGLVRGTLQSPELNFVCRRADDFRTPNILETILRNIAQSEYLIADLTGSNPNVFYELGIAHCIKDAGKIVMLAQGLHFVPFDLRHLRCVLYEQTAPGLETLRTELIATFQDASKNSFRFRVYEGKRFALGRKLVGRNNNLFEITFECVHVGQDAVKLLVHFNKHSIDEPGGTVKSQFLFVSEGQPSVHVDNIPWVLHMVEAEDRMALLALEKAP